MRLVVENIGGGEPLVDRQLMRFAETLLFPISAWAAVATFLRAVAERQFETEGGNSGGWAPLAQSTVDYKARNDLDPRILRATDALMNSLTRKYDPEHIDVPSRDSLVFGSRVAYGIYHASTAPRTKIPYRPPLALTAADKVALVKIMQMELLASSRAQRSSSGILGAVASEATSGVWSLFT